MDVEFLSGTLIKFKFCLILNTLLCNSSLFFDFAALIVNLQQFSANNSW